MHERFFYLDFFLRNELEGKLHRNVTFKDERSKMTVSRCANQTDKCLHRTSAVTEVNSPFRKYLLEGYKYLCSAVGYLTLCFFS